MRCDEHDCDLIPDADEGGRCDYCPECEAERYEALEQIVSDNHKRWEAAK